MVSVYRHKNVYIIKKETLTEQRSHNSQCNHMHAFSLPEVFYSIALRGATKTQGEAGVYYH